MNSVHFVFLALFSAQVNLQSFEKFEVSWVSNMLTNFQLSFAYDFEDYGAFVARDEVEPPSYERIPDIQAQDVPTYVTSSGSRDMSSSGPWEEWRPESQCSRDCGGGVASDSRYCRDPSPG